MAGVDHHTPIEIREKATYTNSEIIGTINALKSEGISTVILSTCNRTEVYCDSEDMDAAVKIITSGKHIAEDLLYQIRGTDVLEHLYKVAAGFESLILGEDQILGQVKDAILISQQEGCSSGLLNQLFRVAISSAKEIKTKLLIRALPVGTPTMALDLVNREFDGRLSGLSALVIGNGQIGVQTAMQLIENGISVTMTKRRDIDEGSLPSGLKIVAYSERYDAVKNVQVIVSATASPHFTLEYKEFSAKMFTRGIENSILLLDLAVPRDIDPEIGKIEGVKLFDTDDIVHKRDLDEEIKKAEEIWARYRVRFMSWFSNRAEPPQSLPNAVSKKDYTNAALQKGCAPALSKKDYTNTAPQKGCANAAPVQMS